MMHDVPARPDILANSHTSRPKTAPAASAGRRSRAWGRPERAAALELGGRARGGCRQAWAGVRRPLVMMDLLLLLLLLLLRRLATGG